MSIEQSKEALLEQLEALKKENEQLRKELSTLRDEKYNDRPVSFKEKYAVRILDDKLTPACISKEMLISDLEPVDELL